MMAKPLKSSRERVLDCYEALVASLDAIYLGKKKSAVR